MAERKEYIVMLPFMAQGHILPFLALAHQIEQKKEYTIAFVNTPLNINKIRSSLNPNSSICLLEIPFNSSDHGLPPNTENTDVLSIPDIITFLQTSHSFKPSFRQLIADLIHEQQGHLPLCLVSDMFFPWCADIAREFGVFHAIFNASSGYGMAIYHSLWSNLPLRGFDSDEFLLPGFPKSILIRTNQIPEHLITSKSTDSFTIFLQKCFDEWLDSDGYLLNTVEEFDLIGLIYFREKLNMPVWPIGPILLSMGSQTRGGKESGVQWESCKKWLDYKPSNSVLYISFGSQATISASQMLQLAIALESSGTNFIWVVRPPCEFDIKSEFNAQEWLPKGFEERIINQEKGLLVRNWAAQLEILSHKSIAIFLSHCGWNSVLESLSNGVPILAWPLLGEQHFNAKMLEEEIGVCVQVAEGTSSEVKHEDIVEKIELVMNETETAERMRSKACEVKQMIENAMKDEENFKGPSVKAFDEFIEAAFSKREKTKSEQKNGASTIQREDLED